jgi:hypothetical protein
MSDSPFDDPKARIKSAFRHVKRIKQLEQDYFGSGAFEWRQECGNGVWTNTIKQTKDIPDELEHTTWDAIQNLRASLDLAVCATARHEGVPDLKNIQFPFAPTEAKWLETHKGRLKGVPEYAIQTIHRFKPWQKGNPTLYSLSQVSRVTKHRIISPVVLGNDSFMIQNDINWSGPGPHRYGVHGWDDHNKELIITETGFPIPIPIKGYQFDIFLAFGRVATVEGERMIPMLDALIDECHAIIQTLEAATRP